MRHALLGDLIAAEAVGQGGEGLVVFGAIRDVESLVAATALT